MLEFSTLWKMTSLAFFEWIFSGRFFLLDFLGRFSLGLFSWNIFWANLLGCL